MAAFRVAILDMYNNQPGEGMRCIRQLLHCAQADNNVSFEITEFNVRANNEVPGLDYDIYVSSGGPGSPLASGEAWEPLFFEFVDKLLAYNEGQERKKFLLGICHSFQLLCRHLGVGTVSKRKSTSFGVLPMHLTSAGYHDPVLRTLPEPFYAVDSRDYQVTDIRPEQLEALGATVLCIEKERPHVPLARAVMAIRFSPEVLATQFHPEADGEGMYRYMLTDVRKAQVITAYGEEKYAEMMELLPRPDTIELTESIIVPTFLRLALEGLREPVAA